MRVYHQVKHGFSYVLLGVLVTAAEQQKMSKGEGITLSPLFTVLPLALMILGTIYILISFIHRDQ